MAPVTLPNVSSTPSVTAVNALRLTSKLTFSPARFSTPRLTSLLTVKPLNNSSTYKEAAVLVSLLVTRSLSISSFFILACFLASSFSKFLRSRSDIDAMAADRAVVSAASLVALSRSFSAFVNLASSSVVSSTSAANFCMANRSKSADALTPLVMVSMVKFNLPSATISLSMPRSAMAPPSVPRVEPSFFSSGVTFRSSSIRSINCWSIRFKPINNSNYIFTG